MTGDENKPAKWNPVANSEATRFRKGQSGNPGRTSTQNHGLGGKISCEARGQGTH